MRVFITGDSHTGAMKRGLSLLEHSGWSCPGNEVEVLGLGSGRHMLDPFFEDINGVARMVEPSYRARIPQLPLDVPETIYGWCGLFHFARLWRNGSWIHFQPAWMRRPRRPVSSAMLRDIIRRWFGQQLALLELLRDGGARVIAIESPRPFRHHPAMRKIRPEVVAAVDGYCQAVMLGELADRSIEVLRIPGDCVDADGFMHAKWRHEVAKDPHHGGAEFGAMMIRRLCETLNGESNG